MFTSPGTDQRTSKKPHTPITNIPRPRLLIKQPSSGEVLARVEIEESRRRWGLVFHIANVFLLPTFLTFPLPSRSHRHEETMDSQESGKDFHPETAMNHQSSTQPMNAEYSNGASDVLQQIQTNATGSVTISSELFERLYLQPKVADPAGLKHPLQKLFANPTPLSVHALLLSSADADL